MTEPDLGVVAEVAARETEPPPFGDLVEHARERVVSRRRRLAGAVAAVVVVAGIGTALGLTTGGAGPDRRPGGPAPDRATPIIATGRLAGYAATADGTVLTLWQKCGDTASVTQSSCYSAWQVQGPAGRHDGLISFSAPTVTAAGDAFALTSYAADGILVRPDGSTRPLARAAPREPRRGDVVVPGTGEHLLDPRTGTLAPVPVPPSLAVAVAAAALDDAGTLWVTPAYARPGRTTLAWLRDGRWHLRVLDISPGASPGPVVASGSHIAALSTFDGATLLPVGNLTVSSDAGATWTNLRRADVPFATVGSLAATDDGTLFVSDDSGAGSLYRSTDPGWTHFTRVPVDGAVGILVASGDRMLTALGNGAHQRLVEVTDEGTVTTVAVHRPAGASG